MSEARLVSIDGAVMAFSDGSTVTLPVGTMAAPLAGGTIMVWELQSRRNAGRIGAGRTREDVEGFLRWLAGEGSR